MPTILALRVRFGNTQDRFFRRAFGEIMSITEKISASTHIRARNGECKDNVFIKPIQIASLKLYYVFIISLNKPYVNDYGWKIAYSTISL